MTIETSYNNRFGSGDRTNDGIELFWERSASITEEDYNKLDGLIDGEFPTTSIGGNRAIQIAKEVNQADSWGRVRITFPKKIGISHVNVYIVTGQAEMKPNRFRILNENKETIGTREVTGRGSQEVEVEFGYYQELWIEYDYKKDYNGGMYHFTVAEVEFKTIELPQKIIIKKDSQYGYYTNSFQSLGTSYPTKEQFEQYGMSDLSMLEAEDIPVEYEMELINQTDEEKCFSYSFDLNGQHKNIKSIDGIITE